jgi:hypothetical protein
LTFDLSNNNFLFFRKFSCFKPYMYTCFLIEKAFTHDNHGMVWVNCLNFVSAEKFWLIKLLDSQLYVWMCLKCYVTDFSFLYPYVFWLSVWKINSTCLSYFSESCNKIKCCVTYIYIYSVVWSTLSFISGLHWWTFGFLFITLNLYAFFFLLAFYYYVYSLSFWEKKGE